MIRADPSRPDAGTIKTLTVRARLRLRGWWTFGISHVAERFLLGRYTALVEQGRRIELQEIARWRETGKAQELLVGKLTAAPEAAAKEEEDEDGDGLDSAEEDADSSDSSCGSNDGFHSVNGSFYAFSMKSGMVSGYQSANELDPEAGLIHNARHDSHHIFTSRLFRGLTSYDVASSNYMLIPRLLNSLTCYDEASLICKASNDVASNTYMLNPLLLT